jgi:hypothetical protein
VCRFNELSMSSTHHLPDAQTLQWHKERALRVAPARVRHVTTHSTQASVLRRVSFSPTAHPPPHHAPRLLCSHGRSGGLGTCTSPPFPDLARLPIQAPRVVPSLLGYR